MARKLVVSVLSKVVGVRLEALDLLRTGFPTRPSGLKWPALELAGPDEPNGLGAPLEVIVVLMAVFTSETCSPNTESDDDARRTRLETC